jgi:hypothetical protein
MGTENERENDPKLSELLKEWQIPGAPPSLDLRVLGTPKKWWHFLLTGSIRLPMPVAVAIAAVLLVMAFALARERAAQPQASFVNLADFQPVQDPNIHIIRGNHETQ